MEYTHQKLVDIAHQWVIKNTSCGFAIKELKTLEREQPDVLGFGSGQHSVLIEVKISRSDFLADRKKSFRNNPSIGMGTQRFYCCPNGLINKEELPVGWGLLYVNEKGKIKIVHKSYKGNIGERCNGFEKNKSAEASIMYSILRRLNEKGYLNKNIF